MKDRGSGSRSGGTIGGMGIGPGEIVKTREWQVVGEGGSLRLSMLYMTETCTDASTIGTSSAKR